MTDRTQGILNRASDAPKFSGVRWILGDGVLTNYMQSFVDDTMKRNAVFQSNAGVPPKIVRRSPGWCCEWCAKLEGTYLYPDDVPDDVYRRHDNCNCIVEFYPANGKKQDVWTKEWTKAEPDTLKERKRLGEYKKVTVAQLEQRKIIALDPQNKLQQGVGAQHYENMQRMVANSNDETAKAVWEKTNAKIGVGNAKSRGREYQSRGQIYVDIEKNAKGDMWYTPYETTFHESGHAIDWIRASDGSGRGFFLSTTYKNGVFRDTIVKEANAIVDSKAKAIKELFAKEDWATLHEMGAISDWNWDIYQQTGKWFTEQKYSKAKAYAAVSKDLKAMSAHKGGDVSDIMEGATKAKAQGTLGHGASYWKKNPDYLATEAFAEFTSATFTNPESLETLKEWFPESYKIWHEMLDVIVSNGA